MTSMDYKRVVVTGLGVVSPVGIGIDDFWDAVTEGRANYKEITRFPLQPHHKTRIAAEIDYFDLNTYSVHGKHRKRIEDFGIEYGGRAIWYAVAAAKMAVEDAFCDKRMVDLNPERTGVAFGASTGDPAIVTQTRKPTFFYTQYAGLNALSGGIAAEYGLMGPTYAVGGACASGNQNLKVGWYAIREGDADMMIVGSAAAPLVSPHPFDDLDDPISPMSKTNDVQRGMTPFDRDRDGFLLGEGAGALVLEDLNHARKRCAVIYAEVVGCGEATDVSGHYAKASEYGYFMAMKKALRQAGITEDDMETKVWHINAHGSATQQNDEAEARAIVQTFGEYVGRPFISSIKGTTGHAMEASSSMELVASALTINYDIVPFTRGLKQPVYPLNFVTEGSVKERVDYVLSLASGFCGPHSAVLLKRFEQDS